MKLLYFLHTVSFSYFSNVLHRVDQDVIRNESHIYKTFQNYETNSDDNIKKINKQRSAFAYKYCLILYKYLFISVLSCSVHLHRYHVIIRTRVGGTPPPVFKHRKEYIYRVYKKKLNKPEIALRLCKAPQCTKFFIEIGCLGTDNVV